MHVHHYHTGALVEACEYRRTDGAAAFFDISPGKVFVYINGRNAKQVARGHRISESMATP